MEDLRLSPLLALLVLVGIFQAACGGSSSETPPPLEPVPAPVQVEEAGPPGATTALPEEASAK